MCANKRTVADMMKQCDTVFFILNTYIKQKTSLNTFKFYRKLHHNNRY